MHYELCIMHYAFYIKNACDFDYIVLRMKVEGDFDG